MLNSNITILDPVPKEHTKASERYLSVRFVYPNTTWEGWVPIEYRRTGLHLETQEEWEEYLNYAYEMMSPENYDSWRLEQKEVWVDGKKRITKPFFDTLVEDDNFQWKCVECTLPNNPNWARRIQDIKEMGYTLATDTHKYCARCHDNKTHIMLLPLPRGGRGNGYETWSKQLRARIIRVLQSIDVFENVVSRNLLPDHKFPEIRWGEDTLGENPDSMTDAEIKAKFQLLTNQRNQQKREVCRNCYQTGRRGTFLGINFYYQGSADWDSNIPTVGRDAEMGCVGCPWYDLAMWRNKLHELLNHLN